MKLSILTSVFITKYPDLKEAVKKIASLGYDAVDICAWYPHFEPEVATSKDIKELKSLLSSYDLRVNQVATRGDATCGIYAMMEGWVKAQLQRLDFAADIGANHLQTLTGHIRSDIPRKLLWKWAVRAHERLAKKAEQVGIPLAVEFQPYEIGGKYRPMNACDLKTLKKFIADVGSDFCKFNLDIGHCNILAKGKPATIKEEILSLRGQIIGVHCNDNDGKSDLNLVPGRGNCDFGFYFDLLNQIGYKGSIGVELEGAEESEEDPDSMAQESFEYLKNLLSDMNLYKS